MKKNRMIKPFDIPIILFSLALTGFLAFRVYVHPQRSTQVLVEGPLQRWVFPLNAEETISVQGPLGVTVLQIHEGEAWVESSPCDNKTCVASGRVHKQGDWVACLPNKVFFILEGNDDPGNTPDRTAW